MVVLAASGEDEAGLLALEKGAAGYLSRDTELTSLAQAVVRVAAGEAAISRVMTSRVVERLRLDGQKWAGAIPPGPGLWKGTNPGGIDEVRWTPLMLTSASQPSEAPEARYMSAPSE